MPVTLSETLQEQLTHHGITQYDEVRLRQELEARVPTYTLIKLCRLACTPLEMPLSSHDGHDDARRPKRPRSLRSGITLHPPMIRTTSK